jgi:hypothetical protein
MFFGGRERPRVPQSNQPDLLVPLQHQVKGSPFSTILAQKCLTTGNMIAPQILNFDLSDIMNKDFF